MHNNQLLTATIVTSRNIRITRNVIRSAITMNFSKKKCSINRIQHVTDSIAARIRIINPGHIVNLVSFNMQVLCFFESL